MNIKLLAKSASQLFTLPEICMKLQDVIYDPASSAADIAKLIAIDPSLSARLLKIANSPFYNFPSQIDDLGRAINLIGTEDLYNLALATSTPDAFSSLDKNDHINMTVYWRHSVMSGLIARTIAQHCKLHHTEQLFLAGLFHNLGQLVVLEQLPELYLQIESQKDDMNAPWDIEAEVLEYTYAEVSATLLECWKMPDNIIALVRAQHLLNNTDDLTAAIIHIATRTSSQIEYKKETGFDFNLTISPAALQTTQLDSEIIQSAIEVAEQNCQSMLSAMTGNQMVVS